VPPNSEAEQLEQAERQRVLENAAKQLEQRHDDVKVMNAMMTYAKCVAVRDHQLKEKVCLAGDLARGAGSHITTQQCGRMSAFAFVLYIPRLDADRLSFILHTPTNRSKQSVRHRKRTVAWRTSSSEFVIASTRPWMREKRSECRSTSW